MNYHSIANHANKVSFQQAVINGLAPDGSLYVPETIPQLPESFIRELPNLPLNEVAYRVARKFVDASVIKDDSLFNMVSETLNFPFPLVTLNANTHILELFHGPTLAFKDVGARFLARVLRYVAHSLQREITVLVATSGDTGGAVASGFYKVEGINVAILYPSGLVSKLQEKQFASLGHNIHALKVDGTFDDCQRLVKEAFVDEELRKRLFLTSANSINIARLIPQTFYYFSAWQSLQTTQPVVFSVPSGNVGNLTAGVIAQKMGLPIHAFVAATNSNSILPEYLDSGFFTPQPSRQTISNAMDVGNPSNFPRLKHFFNNSYQEIKSSIFGYAFSDDETREAIHQVYEQYNYVLDPHGAVGYCGTKKYLAAFPQACSVVLETAHPSKFPEVVESILQQPIPLHPALQALDDHNTPSIACSSHFKDFKKLLTELF